jgi:2-methylcitrate dehydratase PrpD
VAVTIVEELAAHVVGLRCNDLHPQAMETARRSLLDTVGVVLGGTGTAPALAPLARTVLDSSGGHSPVLGFDSTASPWDAAYVNGLHAHAMDFDDTFEDPVCHPSAPVVVGALALADRSDVTSGQELLAAIAIGQDLFVRLAAAMLPTERGLLTTSTVGPIATAATCARLSGLGLEETVAALSAAAAQSGAPRRVAMAQGSDLRSIYVGFAARDAVAATYAAAAGLRGIDDILEGRHGLLETLGQPGGDVNRLTADLGRDFPAIRMSYKPWPSCRCTHGYVEAALRLADGIDAGDIEAVEADLGDFNMTLMGEPRRRPRTIADAKLNLPFVLATALSRSDVRVPHFTVDTIGDPALLALAERVSLNHDPSLTRGRGQNEPARIRISLADGQTLAAEVEQAWGHPDHPVTWQQLTAKFRECAAVAHSPLDGDRVDAVIETAARLDELPTWRPLLQHLTAA